ncbi:MAG: hypothetical protein WAK86_15970 [Pseudonocardiaceae bacterium]
MNPDDGPRHNPAQNSGTHPVIAANTQWHDAELALKRARHSYDRWLIASGKDRRSSAIMAACAAARYEPKRLRLRILGVAG